MSGFLYFIEGASTGNAKSLLEQRGCGYAVRPGVQVRTANTGPGGVPGTVVASGRVSTREVGYFPDNQSWRKVPGQAVWVGVGKESPGPDDLAYDDRLLSGHDVELADGRTWRVPVARWLPRAMDLDEDGNWVTGSIVEKYRSLWDIATDWVEAKCAWFEFQDEHQTFTGFTDERIEDQWVYSQSVAAIAANYAIGPVEAAMLGLFVTGGRWLVLDALIDEPGLMEIMRSAIDQKKTDDTSDTLSTTDGTAAD